MRKTLQSGIFLILLTLCLEKTEAQSNGFLKITVNQTATLYLDGKNLGDIEPNEEKLLEVRVGSHQLKVIKEGYKTYSEEITINGVNEILEKRINLLRPENFQVDKDISGGNVGVEYGELTVVTKFSGSLVAAKVYVDDKLADNAPTKITKLFVGLHTIRVEYNSMSKTRVVAIQKNKSDVLEIEFLSFSSVSFISSQTAVRGTIDLKKDITVPSLQELSMGEHTLSFVKPGLLPAKRNVSFDGESKYIVTIDLKATYPDIKPEVIGRTYRQPYKPADFEKPTKYKPFRNPNRPWNDLKLAGGFVALIAGGILAQSFTDEPVGYWGVGIGAALITYAIIPPKKSERDKYIYNTTEVPKILNEKNKDINRYNEETKSLLDEKQKEAYNQSAITIVKE
jgi:hypothetical protein